ncbi:MAG: hypothetical protein E7211_04545 [Clostridium lundense]|nr:hypothetical protein [Clostridium lundense]
MSIEKYNNEMKFISSKLTGNKEKDIEILESLKCDYIDHEYGDEIIDEINRIIGRILYNEEEEEFDNAYEGDINKIMEELKLVQKYINENNIEKAEKIILDYLPMLDICRGDKINLYMEFRNPLEEIYYKYKFENDKIIKKPVLPIASILEKYVYILIKKGELEKALKYIEKGIKCNPLNMAFVYQKASIHAMLNNAEDIFEVIKDSLKLCYIPEELARSYRMLGGYFTEKGLWKEAICCYLYSNFWEETEIANGELDYISETANINIDIEHYINITPEVFKKHGVLFKPDYTWIEISYGMASEFEKSGRIDDAIGYYMVCYNLTKDEELKEKLQKLLKRN